MTKKRDNDTKHTDHKTKADSSSDPRPEARSATALPTIFSLTPAQSALLASLTPFTNAQIAHFRKITSDVSLALNAEVLQAINDNPMLGGPDRAARIKAALVLQGKLLAVNAVLAPLMQLVANNLLSVNAGLGGDVYEALKVAKAVEKSQPELSRSLKTAQDWSDSHHAAHHASTKATT